MLKDVAVELMQDWKTPNKKFNCAEVTLRALNQYYDLGLSEETLKTACGFGGGMRMGDTCGIVTGGVIGLSLMFGNDDVPYNNPKLSNVVKNYLEAFNKQHGSIKCADIKLDEGCFDLIANSMGILEKVIDDAKA